MAIHLPGSSDAWLYPKTMFGPALVCTREGDDGRAVRLLRVGRSVQSATYVDEDCYTEPVFDYYLAFDLMFEANPGIADVLMVGGGGYAYPKHLIATKPQARIDVVEIDPAITQIAREHFFLDKLVGDYRLGQSGRLGLICDDGARYLAQCDKRYDAIAFDSFAGKRPVASLAAPECIQAAHACLNPGGVLVANVVSALAGPKAAFLGGYLANLRQTFAHVQALPLSPDAQDAPDNVIVLASDTAFDLGI